MCRVHPPPTRPAPAHTHSPSNWSVVQLFHEQPPYGLNRAALRAGDRDVLEKLVHDITVGIKTGACITNFPSPTHPTRPLSRHDGNSITYQAHVDWCGTWTESSL